jgi:hypothetical protein
MMSRYWMVVRGAMRLIDVVAAIAAASNASIGLAREGSM